MADTKKTAKKAEEVKTIDQLQDELLALQTEHIESRKSHVQGELINPHVLTTQRKSIARLHTAINSAKQAAVKEEN
ncbi:50S ribosomal protein L29 [Candidatus Saccharibacteria bacterium]|nr:50S ribosomal protein L29 [Candidatus Saccharibacteria bacterium]|tara:strand:- start:65 stop:292 length:228 start_codon:yes stop_codon:yes gene_type:complete